MSLQKREVFPNRFRYVCATCSFNWPRTPLPENELPPAPRHSCRGAAQSTPATSNFQTPQSQEANASSPETKSPPPIPDVPSIEEPFPADAACSGPQASRPANSLQTTPAESAGAKARILVSA